MLSARGSFACAAVNGGIIVAGGGSRHAMFGAAGSRMSLVERYDVEKNELVEMDGLPRFRGGCVGFLVGNGEEMEFWVMGWYGESRTVSGVFPVGWYALYEELDAEDMERKRELLAAQFEIRQKNIDGARKLLGNAIGRAPKDKIFKKYIEIEPQLGKISRSETLYEKYRNGLLKIAMLGASVDQLLRSLRLIGFGRRRRGEENDRALYGTKEAKPPTLEVLFENAINHLRTSAPSSRKKELSLLEEWLTMESSFGNTGDVGIVQNKLPKKLKKRREIVSRMDLTGTRNTTTISSRGDRTTRISRFLTPLTSGKSKNLAILRGMRVFTW
ncbi:hypothetical protein IFM89_014484 [Coptis chinensis]|uniref:Uncharacterized protein n=1 Tax=Coptis chinensis TaxID=261450 RepID=A0A835LJA2_9MAGN|nr:hypothetical protein IFM89_014484 [Coptis chinensis]